MVMQNICFINTNKEAPIDRPVIRIGPFFTFCSISLTKIVAIKATAELLCVSEQHTAVCVWLLSESTFF